MQNAYARADHAPAESRPQDPTHLRGKGSGDIRIFLVVLNQQARDLHVRMRYAILSECTETSLLCMSGLYSQYSTESDIVPLMLRAGVVMGVYACAYTYYNKSVQYTWKMSHDC